MSGRYDNVAVALHWILVVGILCQIALGLYLGEVPRNTPARTVWVNFHKSVGITLGLLILFRLYWRLTHRPPALPETMAAWERFGTREPRGLYACMVGMPAAATSRRTSASSHQVLQSLRVPPWGYEDKQIYALSTARTRCWRWYSRR
jgi:cytochrome b561